MNQEKSDKSMYFRAVFMLALSGFIGLPILGCAAFQHGYETRSYQGVWMEVIERDTREKCGWKRLQNEMEYDNSIKAFVTMRGLPDHIYVADSSNIKLTYLKDRLIHDFKRPFLTSDSEVTSTRYDKIEKLPKFIVKAFKNADDSGKGPETIKPIVPPKLYERGYGKKYAIVIGVSDYKELKPESEESDRTRLLDLKYADDDAKDFINFLEAKEKSGGDWQVYSFIDQKANEKNVRKKLDDVLTWCRPPDLIYIFFSGHGRCTPYNPADIYLLTYDFRYEDYYDGIPYDWLRGKIEESPAEHIIAFIDACRSGTIGFAKGGANRPDASFMGELDSTRPNAVIFTSGRSTQQAFESDELENGVFAHFLVRGLNGEAPDLDNDDFVDLSELRDYVEDNVISYTSSNEKMTVQTPRLWERKGLIADDFPVALRH